MIDHVCYPPEYCCCDSQALEPDEECPVHGYPKPIDNCMVCGRFVRRRDDRTERQYMGLGET